jgi:formate dehydrogenase subunit delta
MTAVDLIRMANQIAANFAAHEEAEAVEAIANHLRQFWEPRMREELLAVVAEGQAEGLLPQVRDALQRIEH